MSEFILNTNIAFLIIGLLLAIAWLLYDIATKDEKHGKQRRHSYDS